MGYANKTKEQLIDELVELQKSEEQYRSLILNIPDVAWTSDKDYRIVFVSPNIERLCGYTQEEEYQIGDWLIWYERVHPDDVEDARIAFRALIESGKHYDIEYRFKRKDGRWIWVHDRSVGTYERGGVKYADGLLTDITRRKQAEKKLRNFQKRLRSLASETSLAEERERRRLAAGLHDQIGQTLAAIKMELSVLQETSPHNADTKRLFRIEEMVEDVIKRTRSLTFELSPPHLYELGLEAAAEWLTGQFNKEQDIACRFQNDLQPKPLGDDQRGILFVAIRELLANIAKHARAKTARISIQREKNNIRIEVWDDGVGFKTSELEGRGSGFGLFSIRERLRYLGGSVAIDSDWGCGTRITLIAPLQRGGKTKVGRLL